MAVRSLQTADVNFIAVHCSATPPTMDVGAAEIDRWHRQRGFLKIGYHFVIRRNGQVEKGRATNEVGAHIEGHNSESIGICLVGGVDASKLQKPQNNFTPEQFAALDKLLRELRPTYPTAVIQGHRDFPNVAKACPSFDVKPWVSKQGI